MTNYIVLNEDQLLANLARKLPDVKFEVFLEVIKMCEVEQEPKTDVLDRIREEIEQTAKDYDKFDDYRRVRGLWIALDIIDKYRQEGRI